MVNFFNSDDDRQSDFINRDDMNDTGLVELVHGIQNSEHVGGVFPACSGSSQVMRIMSDTGLS